MQQQAELALADPPVAPTPLRLVGRRGRRPERLAAAEPVQVPAVRTLFPAIHHIQPDRSALDRANALWAATRRAADLGRRRTASRLWSRAAAGPWSSVAVLTGSEAVIPVDRFNDVYGAGVGGSLWGTLTRPASRVWPETPYMLAMFLAWARPLLEAELAA